MWQMLNASPTDTWAMFEFPYSSEHLPWRIQLAKYDLSLIKQQCDVWMNGEAHKPLRFLVQAAIFTVFWTHLKDSAISEFQKKKSARYCDGLTQALSISSLTSALGSAHATSRKSQFLLWPRRRTAIFSVLTCTSLVFCIMQGSPVDSAFCCYLAWYLEAYPWAEITSYWKKKKRKEKKKCQCPWFT